MPQVNYNTERQLIDVAPKMIGGIAVYNRKARFGILNWDTYNKKVYVECEVFPYQRNEDRSYGNAIVDDKEMPIVKYVFIASDDMVDAATGDILCKANEIFVIDNTDPENPVTVENPVLAGKNYMPEYDFYCMLADTQEVNITQLIQSRIISKLGA